MAFQQWNSGESGTERVWRTNDIQVHVAAKENETVVSLEVGTECVCRTKAKELINGIAAKGNDS